ncbi:MAG: hypothetical protein PHF63_13645 [Herbinix sp.]|nr:hypothetical protein [Herbinix sp.]
MQPRFDRGYTGHEELCGFGLINMNSRMYGPYLQRFLSPDNYVSSPDDAQSYNRYTYCLNNPLMYTDPTGWTETTWNPGEPWEGNYDWATGRRVVFRGIDFHSFYGSGFGRNFNLLCTQWQNHVPEPEDITEEEADEQIKNSYFLGSGASVPASVRSDCMEAALLALQICTFMQDGYGVTPISAYGNGYLVSSVNGTNGLVETQAISVDIAFNAYNMAFTSIVNQDVNGQGGSYSNSKNTQTGIGAFNVGNGVKGNIIDYAVASSVGKSTKSLKRADYVAKLGKTGANYVRAYKVAGGVTFGVSAVISAGLATNYYMNGGTDYSVGIKAGIDIVMGLGGFIGPIGFGISAAYFIIDAASGGFGGYGDPLKMPKK